MGQFWKILKFEMKYYFKNKVFVGVTIFLVIAIAVIMFFPRIMDAFQKEERNDTVSESSVMLVKTDLPELAEMVTESFAAAFPGYDVQSTGEDLETLKEQIVSGNAECAFVVTGATSYCYYVNNLSIYDVNADIADSVLQHVYRMNAMISSGMTVEQVGEIMSVQITREVTSLGKDQVQNYWYTYIMIFALYMVIMLYGQMVATNVATEKSSRAMEVLITSANPTSMMFGKVIASCMAGLVQLVAIFGSAIFFYNLNEAYWGDNAIIASIFDMPLELFAYMLIFFVLGFFIYAFLYGAVGSTASKLEDINTSVMPITLLFVGGFLVVMYSFAAGDVDNVVMKICSYVPFTSSMAMFTRIAMSDVAWYEIVISVAILIGSVFGVGVLSAKIYRVGVLLYGTTPKMGAIIKAVWKA